MSEDTDTVATAPVGATALRVTRLGLGTAPLGGWPTLVGDDVARATIRHAYDHDVRLFDTAPLYGHGTSERRLGEVLAGVPRESFVLTTKVGRLLRRGAPLHTDAAYDGRSLFAGEHDANPVYDFSYDGALRSLEESLERLGLDRVDAAYIHDPDDHYEAALSGAYRALDRLRAEGVITAVGVGMNQSAMLARFAREGDFDVFLLAGRYTLLEQGALDDLLPACAERGASVVLGGVFNSGLLVDPRADSHYNYAPAPADVVDRARRIQAVCERHGVPLPAAALQFAGAHPAVASVLTGARAPGELEQNLAFATVGISPDLWSELQAEGLLRHDAPLPAAGAGRA
ncbi:MAG: D-threo-aldose 1-dehydrogenase [Solirubrobacteraceae bacterium]|nr:D-threo-aldose 1-dehydrogenase [Solirubrobacteraceae bacterium]